MSQDQKRRPWFQFSLRSMLIVMVLSSAAFGWWIHWSREWIRQRHEAIETRRVHDLSDSARTTAPGGLWLFGEDGVISIICSPEDVELARRLFPEAIVAPLTLPRQSTK